MKFTINKDSSIIKYKLSDVVKAAKKDTVENPQFDFDSNYTLMMFFSYFIDLAEKENDEQSINILKSYILNQVSKLPVEYEKIVDKCLDLLEYDKDLEQMFKSSSVEVITAFFYHPFSSFIYDELFLFYDKAPITEVLKEKFKTDNFSQITYELNLDVSKKIKEKLGEEKYKSVITDEEIKEYEEALKEQKKSKSELVINRNPNDLNEAVEVLIDMFDNNDSLKQVDINLEESTEVFTSMLFFHIYDVLLFSFKLYDPKTKLVKYFKKEKNIEDPYTMIFIMLKTFVNYVKLKKSI